MAGAGGVTPEGRHSTKQQICNICKAKNDRTESWNQQIHI